MTPPALPSWASDLLVCPTSGARLSVHNGRLLAAAGAECGAIPDGIGRFPFQQDAGGGEEIRQYRAIGGAHFHERRHVAFAMSALDTPIYHRHLERFRGEPEGIVVDVGGGDGRNAWPFLEWGHRHIVVIDAVGDALLRFRERVAAHDPNWLDRLLLIEADARSLPLASRCATHVMAIEALCYLNEDYQTGLHEVARLLMPQGRLLLSERDWESGLVMRLIHYGLGPMLQGAECRSLWDGTSAALMETRCFTEGELRACVSAAGLKVEQIEGTPLLSLILGWMRAQQKLAEEDHTHLPAVARLLEDLAVHGRSRRCHVVTARRDG